MTSTMITVFERCYKIDRDALQEYTRTTQAGGVSPIIQGNENKLTNGVVLAKLLETVDGGVCHSDNRWWVIGDAHAAMECLRDGCHLAVVSSSQSGDV